jgi:hypothetical protein
MSAEQAQVPDGAAVFPLIPAELGVHPLLLAVLHSVVFLDGSDDEIVHPDAAAEALEYLAGYLQRLEGAELQRVQQDLQVLTALARQEEWPRPMVQFLRDFLSNYGVGDGGESSAPDDD